MKIDNQIPRFDEFKRCFKTNLNSLRNFKYKAIDGTPFHNLDYRDKSNSYSLPVVFEPYRKYIERTLNTRINLDIKTTAQDIRNQDQKIIQAFRTFDFDMRGIHVDTFLYSVYNISNTIGLLSSGFMPIQIDEAADSYSPNTSAGFPLYGKKKGKVQRDDAISYVLAFIENPNPFKLLLNPCTIFHRFVVRLSADFKENVVKSRTVWGFPFRVSLLEAVYFRSILNNVLLNSQTGTAGTALGLKKSQISDSIISPLRSYNKKVFSLDFSLYDSTLKPYFWAALYAVLFTYGSYSDKDRLVLKSLMIYHNFGTYATDDQLFCTLRGIKSGSLLTAFSGTFFSRIMSEYAAREYTKNHAGIGDYTNNTGDDSFLREGLVPYKYYLKVLQRFGVIANPDKTRVSKPGEDILYMGYVWNTLNEPTQTLQWYVAHLCVPGRQSFNQEIPNYILQTYRALTICCGLANGLRTFNELIGFQDNVYRDLISQFNQGGDPKIYFIDKRGEFVDIGIPLEEVLNFGWRAF